MSLLDLNNLEPWDDNDILAVINRKQRQILVHSFLYYKMDESIITDHEYDALGRSLARMIEEYPEEFKKSAYYKNFIGFDGSTGFDLPYSNPEIERAGLRVLEYEKKLRKKSRER